MNERCYLWLLHCYPGRFRARFEDGMRDAFRQDHAEACRRGVRALAGFWIVTVAQAVCYGLEARRPAGRTSVKTMSFVDWRDAWRSLRATPVITLIAVLSLALGTGANTALFSILNSMLYKALPVEEPDRLMLLKDGSWTNPIWEQIRDRHAQFSDGAFAWSTARFDMAEQGQTDYVLGAYTSGAIFDVLGVRPAAGRLFLPEDDRRGGGPNGPVAVLGYDYWQRRYGGAMNIIGQPISVSRVKFTIVGVAARGFFGPEVGTNLAIIIPLASNEVISGGRSTLDGRSTWWLDIMARLKPGQSPEEAATALNGSRQQIREATLPPQWRADNLAQYLKDPFAFEPATTGVSTLRDQYRQPLTVVLVIVGIVLVIACANIANVLIARATARRHELCVRLALGATRWRLARQLLIESLLLAASGATLGLVFAQFASALVVRQISASTFLDLSPDLRVLGFTAGVAVATAILFGVAPSLGVTTVTPNEVLKERSRGMAGDSRFGVRNALVMVQVALSLALVVGAGLFVRTFSSLVTRPLGFDVDPVLVTSINVQNSRVPKAAWPALFEQLREAAAAVPGVESATLSFTTPIGGMSWNTLLVLPELPELTERERAPWVNLVTPEWFQTYGMRLVAGRNFNASDTSTAPKVTIVTRAFAKKYLPGGNPIGRQVLEQGPTDPIRYEVVGLVEDAAYRTIRGELPPIMYRPTTQGNDDLPSSSFQLSARARAGSATALVRPLTAALTAVEPTIALNVRPLSVFMQNAVRQERLVAMLSGFFGGLALLLAALGLYGVTSYAVNRRRGEIGIRMALGARPERIVRMVLARTGWIVAAGVGLGAVLSLWIVRYVGTLLYGVDARDPVTIVGAVVVLGSIGLLAAWLPARRASRIDPTVTLRAE